MTREANPCKNNVIIDLEFDIDSKVKMMEETYKHGL